MTKIMTQEQGKHQDDETNAPKRDTKSLSYNSKSRVPRTRGGLASVQENLAHGSSKSASFCESRPTNTCRNLAPNSPRPAANILLATERGRTHRLDSTKPRIQLLSIFSQHMITTLFSQK